jgi:hypothetical protein
MNNKHDVNYLKYLKYKNKYNTLKNQLIGGNRHITLASIIPEPWYNLSKHTLFCSSDFEGGAPFTNFRDDRREVSKELNNAFVFENGMISDIKENIAFSFVGDLLDNNCYSIRLMHKMINLKNKYPTRVIIIGGNRDFNKVRMGIELFMQTSNKELPWLGTVNMDNLIERLNTETFEFRHQGIPDYLQNVTLWDKIISEGKLNIYNEKQNFYDRILTMYKFTKGIQTLDHMKNELKQLYPNTSLDKLTDDIWGKLLCTIHMVMAFEWNSLPNYLLPLNGLYIKYLSICHVIAGFNIDGKLGILSHGSIPLTTGTDVRKLTYPFGYNNNSQKAPLITIIKMIESEKMELIKECSKLRDTPYNTNFPMINKFIHLTALTSDNKLSNAHSKYSPVVWSQPEPINNLPDIKIKLSGKLEGGGYETWYNNDLTKPQKYVLEDGNDIINYNIFGHAPAYYNPLFNRKQHTLHVNLDISKIDGQSNSTSFAFLVISNTITRILGRIKFQQMDNNKNGDKYNYVVNTGYETEEIRKQLAGHDHYYKIDIPQIGPVHLLKTDKIPGLNYIVKPDGFNKLISIPK